MKQPLWVIGSYETTYPNLIIDSAKLKVIRTYEDSLELVPFGEKGKEGVVIAELRTKVPLFRLPEVLDYY